MIYKSGDKEGIDCNTIDCFADIRRCAGVQQRLCLQFQIAENSQTHPTVNCGDDDGVEEPIGLGKTGGIGSGDMLAPLDLLIVGINEEIRTFNVTFN